MLQPLNIIETRADGSIHRYTATQDELVDVISDKLPEAEYQELPYRALRCGVAGPVPADVLRLAVRHGHVVRVDGRWLTPLQAPSFARWLRDSARRAFETDLRLASPTPARRAPSRPVRLAQASHLIRCTEAPPCFVLS